MSPSKDIFKFAGVKESPLRAITQRIIIALSLLCAAALAAYLDRYGYSDSNGDIPINLLDAFYYATVSVTTTGYGDIVPVSNSARLLTTLIITPLRVLFLILLVGTTVEVLASHTRFLYKLRRWQGSLKNHTVICGFGVKGRSALAYLRESEEIDKSKVVVIDPSQETIEAANNLGVSGIIGSASSVDTLKQAMIEQAAMVLVSPPEDDTAVLITLRARELNPNAKIVATCREEQNVTLLKNSGADTVIVSASAAGRLMGLSAHSYGASEVITDLLASGHGIDIEERPAAKEEIGLRLDRDETFLAIIRNEKLLRFSDGETGEIQSGDRVVYIRDSDK